MSSILKALKKLEDEKATLQPVTLKIDSDILSVESSQHYSTTGVILAALLLFAGGSIATYLYMKQGAPPVVANNIIKNESLNNIKPSPRTPAADAIKTEKLPEALEIIPAQSSKSSKAALPTKLNQVASAKSARGDKSSPHVQPKSEDRKNNQAVATVPLPSSVKSVPTLRVNGIAFQAGAADSLAVVNGTPVSSGSLIEGVKVEVIQKDRVRFSYLGEVFDIALGKSNR